MSTAPVSPPDGVARRSWRDRGAAARLPQLVLLRNTQRRSRLPFALVVLLLIGSGLIGLLLLNTVLAQDAFVLFHLQQQSATLRDQEQQLREAVAGEAGPTVLASRAAALGMVPGGDPLFLRLPDGAVLGDPKTAGGVAAQSTTRASITPTPASRASIGPTAIPSPHSSGRPTVNPTVRPAAQPTLTSTLNHTVRPTSNPAAQPTPKPTGTRP